jgi:hypothetical protein
MPSGNGKNVDSPLDQSRPQNESGGPSPQSASSNPQRSGLGRTLLLAGVFALLAMVFVPTPMYEHGHRVGGGYRFIFDNSNTSVAFFQLLVNVAVAALFGAIIANLSKRARRISAWIGGCMVGAAMVGFALYVIIARAQNLAEVEEHAAHACFTQPFGTKEIANAKEHFRNAAFQWRLALQFENAKSDEERANTADAEMERAAKKARADEEKAKADEEIEKLVAKTKEFSRQWQMNAQKVIDAHPELRSENSLYALAMKKILSSNPVYSKRVDGYELAYTAIRKQLPPPGGVMTMTEFYRLLENLKTDVAPAVPLVEPRNP